VRRKGGGRGKEKGGGAGGGGRGKLGSKIISAAFAVGEQSSRGGRPFGLAAGWSGLKKNGCIWASGSN